MQLSSLLRPEKVKNYQKTALKEDVVKFYDRCLKVQIYDLGKLNGITLPISKAGLDGNYYGGEQVITKAVDSGIDLWEIATDVFTQLSKMGWDDANAKGDENSLTINLTGAR